MAAIKKENSNDGDVAKALQERSLELKTEANNYFKAAQYEQSISIYTEAIETCPSPQLYANRAAAYLRTEAFGLAKIDAEKAIEMDPKYVKAYYRLGSAHVTLGHYKKAQQVFRKVVKLAPKDRDAIIKYKECDKIVKRAAFDAAIAMEQTKPPSELLDPNNIKVPDSYDGPKLSEDGKITQEFINEMTEYFKSQKVVHKKYVVTLLIQFIKTLQKLPSLIECEVPENEGKDSNEEIFFTVCGDTHGQWYDLMNIFEINGGPPCPERPYLFNGDFVDRGSWSFEVVFTLIAYKCLYPEHLHMLRGNHESKQMNKIYGFEGEVKAKYDESLMTLFTEAFQWLPLCATIENKVVVMHGGLFSDDNVKLEDIKKTFRVKEPPESGIMSEIIWSDPQPFPGRGPSKRGVGLTFGPDITKKFLENNGLELLIRSHEVKQEGYLVEHDGKLITIFSAPNYVDQVGNKGALIRFKKDCKPIFKQFEAVPHPDIKPMAYAGNMGMFGM